MLRSSSMMSRCSRGHPRGLGFRALPRFTLANTELADSVMMQNLPFAELRAELPYNQNRCE
jgi:hypothetical protein